MFLIFFAPFLFTLIRCYTLSKTYLKRKRQKERSTSRISLLWTWLLIKVCVRFHTTTRARISKFLNKTQSFSHPNLALCGNMGFLRYRSLASIWMRFSSAGYMQELRCNGFCWVGILLTRCPATSPACFSGTPLSSATRPMPVMTPLLKPASRRKRRRSWWLTGDA